MGLYIYPAESMRVPPEPTVFANGRIAGVAAWAAKR